MTRRIDLRSESGFTLVEMMVATVMGVIVSAATLAIVISSVNLTSNYTDRVDATQQGRLAMQKITQALNSSCVSPSLPPILPNTVDPANTISAISDSNNVWFYSSLSDGATISPNLVEISYTGSSLVMKTYANSSPLASAPNWTFSSPPTSLVLLPYATQATVSGVTEPVFQYFGYSSGTISTVALATPLATTTAAATAQVTITYEAIPSSGWSANSQGRTATFADSVVLRLTPASSTSSTPCT
jgi:prepilin-type N-terminal cleavage/methylation domain-containing protein